MEYANKSELREAAVAIKTADKECSVTPGMVGRSLEVLADALDEMEDPAEVKALAEKAIKDARDADLNAGAAKTSADNAQAAADNAQNTADAAQAAAASVGLRLAIHSEYVMRIEASNELAAYEKAAEADIVGSHKVGIIYWTEPNGCGIILQRVVNGDVIQYVPYSAITKGSRIRKIIKNTLEVGDWQDVVGENVDIKINPETNKLEIGNIPITVAGNKKKFLTIGPHAVTEITRDGATGDGILTVDQGKITFGAGVTLGKNSSLGAGAVIPAGLDLSNYTTTVNNKVDKVPGKGLSANDFTTALKNKLEGLSNYNDSIIQAKITQLETNFDTLINEDADGAINKFNEIVSFLDNIEDTETLEGILDNIRTLIQNAQDAAENAMHVIEFDGIKEPPAGSTINGTTLIFGEGKESIYNYLSHNVFFSPSNGAFYLELVKEQFPANEIIVVHHWEVEYDNYSLKPVKYYGNEQSYISPYTDRLYSIRDGKLYAYGDGGFYPVMSSNKYIGDNVHISGGVNIENVKIKVDPQTGLTTIQCVDTSTALGQVAPLTLGAWNTMGSSNTIQSNVTIYDRATLNASVISYANTGLMSLRHVIDTSDYSGMEHLNIGGNNVIGSNNTLGSNIEIENDVTVRGGTYISFNVRIENAVEIQSGTRIMSQTTIGRNATIGGHTSIGNNVSIVEDFFANIEPGTRSTFRKIEFSRTNNEAGISFEYPALEGMHVYYDPRAFIYIGEPGDSDNAIKIPIGFNGATALSDITKLKADIAAIKAQLGIE